MCPYSLIGFIGDCNSSSPGSNPLHFFLVRPHDNVVFYCFHRFFISILTLLVLRQYLVYEALPCTAVNETSLLQVDGELWRRSLSI